MRTAGFLGIGVALGATYFLYSGATSRSGLDATSPQEQIDVVGIRTGLVEIAQAERAYLARHGTYGTLEQLRAEGTPALGAGRRGYVFDVDARVGKGFRATATPVDANKADWPILEIDETMEISSR